MHRASSSKPLLASLMLQRNRIASILLALLVSAQLLAPLSASAIVLTVPTTTNPPATPTAFSWDTIEKWIVNVIARAAIRGALTALTQEIVGWIKGDGGKNVGFVGNFQRAALAEADAAGGEFLKEFLPKINFCGDIKGFLQLTLRTGGKYQQQAACTISDIIDNVEDHFEYFQNGGWQAFLKIGLQPQNNPNGAFLMTLDAKLKAEAGAVEDFTKKLDKSFPFKGFEVEEKKCDADVDGNEFCTTKKVVKTPGSLITDQLNKSIGSGIDFAVNAKYFDEAIVAIINALMTRVISGSSGGGGGFIDEDIDYGEINDVYSDRLTLNTSVFNALFYHQTVATELNRELGDVQRALYNERALHPATDTLIEKNLEAKVADFQQKNQTLLASERELLRIKQSTDGTASVTEIKRVQNQITALNATAKSIANTFTAPLPAPAIATGVIREDDLILLANARAGMDDYTALLNDLIAEINRLLGIADPAQHPSLESERDKAEKEITALAEDQSAIATAEQAVINAINDGEIYYHAQNAYVKLTDASNEKSAAISLIQTIDAVIDLNIGITNAACSSINAPLLVLVNQTFSASMTMKNTGTLTIWHNDASPYYLSSQNPPDNNIWGLNRVDMPASSLISPGDSITFAFSPTAPATAGFYPFDWRMNEGGVGSFGATCTITVEVTTTPR